MLDWPTSWDQGALSLAVSMVGLIPAGLAFRTASQARRLGQERGIRDLERALTALRRAVAKLEKARDLEDPAELQSFIVDWREAAGDALGLIERLRSLKAMRDTDSTTLSRKIELVTSMATASATMEGVVGVRTASLVVQAGRADMLIGKLHAQLRQRD